MLTSIGYTKTDSVPRAQGKIESNMAYPDMFVQLATRNRVAEAGPS